MNNLDLNALIRCLEVMADENSWEESVLTSSRWLIDATEAPPWEVAKEALHYVNFMLAATKDYESDFEK